MKVVLFCGGLGLRLRDYSDKIPKPMVPIGYRPIIWHLMKYYAHFGHTEFILCLGHGGDTIKEYFLNYNECISNDFVLSEGGKSVRLLNADIQSWKITFVDTGISSTIGQRLKSIEPHIGDDNMFLANYADGLTDLPLPAQFAHFMLHDKVASFLCVTPRLSCHLVRLTQDGKVSGIEEFTHSRIRINGGFFMFKREIFQYMNDGEELVHEPFRRLIEQDQLVGYEYDGFWASMDTFKDKMLLDDVYARGKAPWVLWKQPENLGADRGYVSNQTWFKKAKGF